jgi:hypothetical protein
LVRPKAVPPPSPKSMAKKLKKSAGSHCILLDLFGKPLMIFLDFSITVTVKLMIGSKSNLF